MTNTDNAAPGVVLAELLVCAESWVPEARIIGDIRAADISRAIRAAFNDNVGIPPMAWIDRDRDSYPRSRALTYRVSELSSRESKGRWIIFLGRDQIHPYDEFPSRDAAKAAVEEHFRNGMIEMMSPEAQEG